MNLETNQGERLEKSFDEKKRAYFSRLALGIISAMRLHKKPGLLLEHKGGEREWSNVSEHCLVEVARARAFAQKLNLPMAVRRELELGAALHDFDKRTEIMAMKAAIAHGESGGKASDDADKIGEYQLREAGFSQNVIEIFSSTGGKPQQLFEIMRVLTKQEFTDQDIARLIIHYVDGYTRGSEWAEPAAMAESGEMINEVDRRTQKNLDNPNYKKLNKESVAKLAGNPTFQGLGYIEGDGLVCHMIEKRLAKLINQETGEIINPLELPEIVDREIRSKIEEEVIP